MPVVVATSVADERLAASLRDGASDYALSTAEVWPAVQRAVARRAAERARRQQERREAAMATLGHVAHEINNPLGILLGQADLLQEMVADGPVKERVGKVVQATERCARMIKDFLLVARRQPLDLRPIDAGQLLHDTVESRRKSFRADDIDVEVHVETPLPPISADRDQLRQALLNLLTNAQQALREAAAPRRIDCRARASRTGETVELEVSDSGPGIPEMLQARIFDPFFTAGVVTGGAGLGLAIVQSVVEAHGGMVAVRSRPGAGATFVISLPISIERVPARDVAASGRPGAALLGAASHGGPASAPAKILLVEDKPEVVGVLTDMLAVDGHRVETASDGHGALHKLQEGRYDLIVTDVRMPGLDGPGLYRELERRHPRLRRRVIFCTGEALGAETQTLLQRLDAPVICKPFVVDELRRAIQRVLRV